MSKMSGLFIIMVRTNDDKKINLPGDIENIEINKDLGFYIHVVYTRAEFIDAGEICMQNNNELETHTLINLVKSYIT